MYKYNTTCKIRRWTTTAIECYKRGCNCQGCLMKKLIKSQKCKMKNTVIELVRILGAPNKTAQF